MEAPQIALVQWQKTDAEQLVALANNRKIWLGVRNGFAHPYTLDAAAAYFKMLEAHPENKIFAIQYQGKLAGSIGLHPKDDVYTGNAELGYWVGEPFWGLGIASQAVSKMIPVGFQEMGLRRIFASVYSFNAASMRVLEKNGFVAEGIGRKAILKDGQVWDEHHYGLLP